MAMMKAFALAFSLTVCTVQADNCLAASGGEYRLKADMTIKCDSTIATCTTGSTSTSNLCPCGGSCCEPVPNLCDSTAATATCASGRTVDESKKTLAATTSNYDATCCKAKLACSAHTCGAGHTDSATKASLMYTGTGRGDAECCDVVPCTDCCTSVMGTGTFCPSATHYMSSVSAAATTSNFEANCCTAKKTCDATCGPGFKNKADYATKKCSGSTCSASECCELDSTKCLGVLSTSCGTGTFRDDAKKGNAATSTTYAANCCSTQTTCATFKSTVNTPLASFAMLPQVHAVAFLFSIGLFIAGK